MLYAVLFGEDDLKWECIFEVVSKTVREIGSLWEIGSLYTKSGVERRCDHYL